MPLLNKRDQVKPIETNNITIDDIQVANVLSMNTNINVNDKNIYKTMLSNSLIATAMNLITTDALQTNDMSEKVIWVEPINKASEEVVEEINRFLDEIEVEQMLPYIAKMILAYGQIGIELGVQTKYEDDMTEPHITEAVIDMEDVSENTNARVKDLDQLNFEIPYRWYIQPLGNDYYDIKYKGKRMCMFNAETNKMFVSPLLALFKSAEVEYSFFVQTDFDDEGQQIDRTFTIEKGHSYLEDAKLAFINYNATQQAILLSRITRTQFYRIYEVEIGNQDATSAEDTISKLKGKIQNKQTIDLTQNLLSQQNSISLLTDIFTPIRDGKGSLTLKTVGGDFDPKQLLDLDNARNELIGALKVPHAYVGFVSEQPGGLTDSSIAMQDARYARTVKDLQKAIKFGVDRLIVQYLRITNYDLSDEFGYKVCLVPINTQEEAIKIKTQTDKLQNLDSILNALEKMNVDITDPELRTALISKYIDNDLNSVIKSKEEEVPEESNNDTDIDLDVNIPSQSSSAPSGLSREPAPEGPSQEEIDSAPLGSLQGIDQAPDGLGPVEK